jgi:hypothetical protein
MATGEHLRSARPLQPLQRPVRPCMADAQLVNSSEPSLRSALAHEQHSADVTLFGHGLPSFVSPFELCENAWRNQSAAAHDVAQNHHMAGSFSLLSGISLTVQKVELLVKRLRRINPVMLEVITSFLVILSIGILVAHALDAFRP